MSSISPGSDSLSFENHYVSYIPTNLSPENQGGYVEMGQLVSSLESEFSEASLFKDHKIHENLIRLKEKSGQGNVTSGEMLKYIANGEGIAKDIMKGVGQYVDKTPENFRSLMWYMSAKGMKSIGKGEDKSVILPGSFKDPSGKISEWLKSYSTKGKRDKGKGHISDYGDDGRGSKLPAGIRGVTFDTGTNTIKLKVGGPPSWFGGVKKSRGIFSKIGRFFSNMGSKIKSVFSRSKKVSVITDSSIYDLPNIKKIFERSVNEELKISSEKPEMEFEARRIDGDVYYGGTNMSHLFDDEEERGFEYPFAT